MLRNVVQLSGFLLLLTGLEGGERKKFSVPPFPRYICFFLSFPLSLCFSYSLPPFSSSVINPSHHVFSFSLTHSVRHLVIGSTGLNVSDAQDVRCFVVRVFFALSL